MRNLAVFPGTISLKNENFDKESQEEKAVIKKLEDEDVINLA